MFKECQRLRHAGKVAEADLLHDTAMNVLESSTKKVTEGYEEQWVRRLALEVEQMVWRKAGNPERVMKVGANMTLHRACGRQRQGARNRKMVSACAA